MFSKVVLLYCCSFPGFQHPKLSVFIDGSLLQSSGLTGVCMAASYSVTRSPGLAVVAMWSQPYDLNLYTAYTGAGVTRDRARYSQGLFYAMYYGSGQWSRRGAGTQAR